jgi:hypothetical protein
MQDIKGYDYFSNTMMKQTQDVLHWFNKMQNPIPTWYLGE